jgi:hypothetical protein
MSTTFQFDETDKMILDTLTFRVRAATEQQLGSLGVLCQERASIKLRLNGLARRRLIRRKREALRLVDVVEPLFVWKPGDPAAPYGRLAWRFRKRWSSTPVERTTIVWATARATKIVGGVGGDLRHYTTLEHDLGVMGAFCARVQLQPNTLTKWVSEDVLVRQRRGSILRKVPDAAIVTADGAIETLIEFGGQYSTEKLKTWHRHCQRHGTRYELW